MLAECVSLSSSQYVILVLILLFHISVYKRHPLLRHGLVATLLLLAVYPLVLDGLPRELFSIVFTLLLLVYCVELAYVSTQGVGIAIPASIVIGVYSVFFFVTTSILNSVFLFTHPIDAIVGIYDTGEKVSRFVKKEIESSPSQ